MRKIGSFLRNLPLQTKLILVYLSTTGLILGVNVYLYININNMLSRLDLIYESNIVLSSLSDSLEDLQDNMIGYLNTKTTDAIEGYYIASQNYSDELEKLTDIVSSSDSLRMERNIKKMSERYLYYTDLAVEAKRGRNVEKYKYYSEEAEELYHYINVYITNLNTEQFKSNTLDYTVLSASLRYMEIFNTGVFVAVAFANVLLVLLVIRNITTPLKNLSTIANEVATGNLNVELVDVYSKDEVGVVSNAFNQMIVSVRNYIEQLTTSMENERTLKEKELKMETHLKDAQLKYLQAQINPHFLFNTLNAGAQLAMMEDADKTYEYIQTMAKFFRYNIKKDHDSVPIKEELDLIDNYIYILNVRFSGEIHYKKEVDENLLGIMMPSMILQPIVENAVNYGIRNIDWEGRIFLHVYEENSMAYISITDNGIGVSPEQVERIMNFDLQKDDISDDSNGIGLGNVINRLRLFYGTDDVFEIESPGENQGTCVTIKIPLKEDPNV